MATLSSMGISHLASPGHGVVARVAIANTIRNETAAGRISLRMSLTVPQQSQRLHHNGRAIRCLCHRAAPAHARTVCDEDRPCNPRRETDSVQPVDLPRNIGPPYWIRTSDLRLRRPLLYPTELRAVEEKRHGLTRTAFGTSLRAIATAPPNSKPRNETGPVCNRARNYTRSSRHLTRHRPSQHQTGCGCSMNQPRQNTPAITQYTPNDASRPRPSK